MPSKKIVNGNQDPKRTRKIIKLYRRGTSLRELGNMFGISHARIHQILRSQIPDEIRGRGARYG